MTERLAARGRGFIMEENPLTWWQQIAVALGLGGGALLGGVKLGRKREQQEDPAQRIVDAIREEAAATRRTIYDDGNRTRETLQAGFQEVRQDAGAAAVALARLEGFMQRRGP